jgi:CrcB protein
MIAVWVVLAGSLGSVARFVLDGIVRSLRASVFPWGTLLINVSGSLLLGFLTGATLAGLIPSSALTVFGVGFCGGYTTFSTASLETIRLVQNGRYWLGLANAIGTMSATTGAAALGFAAAGL